MRTSDPILPGPGRRTLVLEAAALALVFGFVPELLRTTQERATVPHPVWLAVLVLAVRYANPGFLAGLAAAAAAVASGCALKGRSPMDVWNVAGAFPDALALTSCLAASWVAGYHTRRQSTLEERLRESTERAADAEAEAGDLRDNVDTLRRRVERTSNSLRFLRDVAGRLDGLDAVAAAEAAADLAIVRTGASTVAVATLSAGQPLLAVRDESGRNTPAPPDLRAADYSVAIRAGHEAVGVIAIWTSDRPCLDDAAKHDLDVVADWCAAAFARHERRGGHSGLRAVETS